MSKRSDLDFKVECASEDKDKNEDRKTNFPCVAWLDRFPRPWASQGKSGPSPGGVVVQGFIVAYIHLKAATGFIRARPALECSPRLYNGRRRRSRPKHKVLQAYLLLAADGTQVAEHLTDGRASNAKPNRVGPNVRRPCAEVRGREQLSPIPVDAILTSYHQSLMQFLEELQTLGWLLHWHIELVHVDKVGAPQKLAILANI